MQPERWCHRMFAGMLDATINIAIPTVLMLGIALGVGVLTFFTIAVWRAVAWVLA